MCLLFFALEEHPDYPVIILANRDEFYARKTTPLHFWQHKSEILAGQDNVGGGTWLGMNRHGSFAAVTNVRNPEIPAGKLSRGEIPVSYLNNPNDDVFTHSLNESKHLYSGVNVIYGQISHQGAQLKYFSNQYASSVLKTGIHGLSNASLDAPWPKIDDTKSRLHLLCKKDFCHEEWLSEMENTNKPDLSRLPDTGVGIESETLLSPCFIQSQDYGTRSTSLITINQQGLCSFIERTHHSDGSKQNRQFSFQIL